MAHPYIGEIRMFAGTFAPAGWLFCQGQVLPIAEYDTLFFLIGTSYGGDGQETFALPDLRGRLPIHQGNGFTLAEAGGVESVTLTTQQMPAHNHPFLGSTNPAGQNDPTNASPSMTTATTILPYGTDQPWTTLAPVSVSPAGGSQPHDNFQPYLCVNFIISLFGIFPTQM